MRRSSPALAFLAAVAALGVVSSVRADIDVEVRSGDVVTGSLDPGSEVETFRFRVPAGAKLSVTAKGLKKGPDVNLSVAQPGEMASPVPTRGKGATLVVNEIGASGEALAVVTSRDGTSKGDYVFRAAWRSPKKIVRTASFGLSTRNVVFAADAGARVRIVAKPDRGSAASPRLVSLTGPSGDLPGFPASGAIAGPVTLAATGDHTLVVQNEGGDGDVTVTFSVAPPKGKPRKLDITTKKTGETAGAYARVVNGEGTVEVPPGIDGLDSLVGTAVNVPPGALPAGTAIVIGTAPDLNLPGNDLAQIGPPAFFGPEGQKFGSNANPAPVEVALPFDSGAVGGDTSQVRIYTRDAKGKVSLVPPPYDFDSKPGFVVFPTSHFSSFVAAAESPSGGGGALTTLVGGLSAGVDLSYATTGDDDATAARLLFFADGTDVLQGVVVTAASPFFATSPFAGGGTGTSDGTFRTGFDFPGTITAVHSGGDAIWVGTDAFTVFRIDGTDGTVTRVLGDGTAGDSGDGGAATSARIRSCADLFEDTDGKLWVVDRVAARVRVVDATGTVTTFAGTGVSGSNGDSLPAASTQLDLPSAIVERYGTTDMVLAERGRVRLLHTDTNQMETIAGDPNGALGCALGGEIGTAARLNGLTGVSQDLVGGAVFVSSDFCDAIYRIDLSTHEVTVAFGTPASSGYSADGTPDVTRTTAPRGLIGLSSSLYFIEAGAPGPTPVGIRQYTPPSATAK